MSNHRVNLDELFDAIDRMAAFEGRLETALQDADTRVNRLHATWTGSAAQEHQAAHARWRQGAQEMHQALITMRQIATTSHANYGSAVEANSGMWAL